MIYSSVWNCVFGASERRGWKSTLEKSLPPRRMSELGGCQEILQSLKADSTIYLGRTFGPSLRALNLKEEEFHVDQRSLHPQLPQLS